MNVLANLLADLADTDITVNDLRALIESGTGDDLTDINIDAVIKRRHDLERKLDVALRIEQHDLIHFRVARDDGESAQAATVARAILLFQELTTAVFDAIRDDPKLTYGPSEENAALSALSFAAPPADRSTISLSIPNERLLGIRSDLDLTFELVFALFQLRSTADLTRFAERTGVAPITRLDAFAEVIIGRRLTVDLVWQKTRESRYALTITSRDAAEIRHLIAAATAEHVEDIELEGYLVSLDEANARFSLQTTDNQEINGLLAYEFVRGGRWPTNAPLVAVVKKSTRIEYATGAAKIRWTLKQLIQIDRP